MSDPINLSPRSRNNSPLDQLLRTHKYTKGEIHKKILVSKQNLSVAIDEYARAMTSNTNDQISALFENQKVIRDLVVTITQNQHKIDVSTTRWPMKVSEYDTYVKSLGNVMDRLDYIRTVLGEVEDTLLKEEQQKI